MAIRVMPEQVFLREALDYDPVTGWLTWRTRPRSHFVSVKAWKRWNTMCAGKSATATAHRSGHRQVCLMNENWLAHRLIWKWVTGNDPIDVGHRNDNPDQNWWGNLREMTRSEARHRVRCVNQLGLKGVYPIQRSRRFGAHIRVKGTLLRLGSYATKEAAHAAYCEAAQTHFGEFWSAG